MWFFSWLRKGNRSAPTTRRRTQTSPRQRASFRPQLEALEDRWLPSALTLTVNSLGDSGTGGGTSGDLRYCINLANQNNNTSSTPDVINFASGLSGTDTLQQGELLITDPNLVINGPGASNLAISGGGQSRVFEVAAGTQVQLSGMTIENGADPPPNVGIGWSGYFNGGGILNYGMLTLSGDIISGNHETLGDGGGIANYGMLTLSGDTISGNDAALGNGGGIANEYGGTMTDTGSTVSGNSAGGGGGIYNDGTMTLNGSTVTQNTAGAGGGIYNGLAGNLTILDHSVVEGNSPDDVYNLGTWKHQQSKIGTVDK